ncbi:hypothetical protein M0805_007761 [Coniferiporia weirii]|nr:hypothetical protein M0805_007761 [Coniferiporia weirii]
MGSTEEHLPALDGTFGCLFLAGIVTAALWGAGSVQLYFYHDNYSKSDKLWLQLYLYVMYVLDTVHQVNMCISLYKYFVKDFANFVLIGKIDRPINDSIIISAIVCALAQSLYLMRIWHLSRRNYILTTTLGLLILTQFVATVIYFAQVYHLTENAELMDPAEIITVRVLNVFATATDVSIATAMAFLLHSQRSGIRQTDTLISRLIIYSISTGLVTGVAGIAALVTAFAFPKTFIYLFFDIPLPKLYINSVLALLNFRQKHRDNLVRNADRGFSLNRMHTSNPTDGSFSAHDVSATLFFHSISATHAIPPSPFGAKRLCLPKTLQQSV